MSTLHRRDISAADLTLLAKFSNALAILQGSNGSLAWHIGVLTMLLPVWNLSASGWSLDVYKEFQRDAYGITVPDFRRICRYIMVSEARLTDTLFRMSMISVVKGQLSFERPKFKMPFSGVPSSLSPFFTKKSDEFGFVIERRRVDGAFK